MSEISFFVPGAPVAKQRARVCGNNAFTPKATVEYEQHVKNCVLEQVTQSLPIWGKDVALAMTICFRFLAPQNKREKSHKRTGAVIREAAKWMITRPDCDNLVKAISDACNKLLFPDDSQIVRIEVEKIYVSSPRNEGARVTIEKL